MLLGREDLILKKFTSRKIREQERIAKVDYKSGSGKIKGKLTQNYCPMTKTGFKLTKHIIITKTDVYGPNSEQTFNKLKSGRVVFPSLTFSISFQTPGD